MYLFIEGAFRRALYQINNKDDAIKYTREFFESFDKSQYNYFYDHEGHNTENGDYYENRKHISLDDISKEVSEHYDNVVEKLHLLCDQDDNAPLPVWHCIDDNIKNEEEYHIHIIEIQNLKK